MDQVQPQGAGVPFISALPNHILVDILSRLSVKSIFTCRCVCKNFLYVTLDPLFAKHHFANAPTCPLPQNFWQSREEVANKLFLVELERDSSFCNMVLLPLCNIRICTNENCDLHVNMKLTTKFVLPEHEIIYKKNCSRKLFQDYEIVNSCNGLLCLRGQRSAVIYNPVTGECMTVTESDARSICGLGFSVKTNQYKVLRLISIHDGDSNYEAEVHSIGSGSGSWRRVGETIPSKDVKSYFVNVHNLPTYLNSTLHWFNVGKGSPDSIFAFDFEEECFKTVASPPPLVRQQVGESPRRKLAKITMGVLRGCLYVCDASSLDHINIWVMKEYGVKESWVIELTFKAPDDWPIFRFLPMDYSKNGDLLVYCMNNTFLSYNGSKYRYFEIMEKMFEFRAIAHVPSFFLLKDVFGDNVEVQKVGMRLANVKPQKKTTEALFLREVGYTIVT